MEQKIRRDFAIISLITDFEAMCELGNVEYIDEKTYVQIIEYYDEEGMADKALEAIDFALEQYQYRADFYITKARILFKESRIAECLEVLDLVSNISPLEKEIIFLKAKCFAVIKDFSQALSELDKIRSIALNDEQVEMLITESYIYEYMKDYTAMYECLKSALATDGGNLEAQERFGLATELTRNYQNSVNFLKDLIDDDPYNYLAWYNLGLAFCYSWEYDSAIDALEYAFIIEPAFEKAYTECAELCVQQKKYSKALKIYNEANNRFGPDTDLMVQMANCYIKLKQPAKAKSILLKALKLDSYNDEVYYYLGESFRSNNNGYSAINAYLRAIDLDPEREEYYLGLAKAHAMVDDYAKAVANFKIAAHLCSEDSQYWKEYVCYILKMGLYKEAILVLDEAEEYTYGADLLYCRAAACVLNRKKREGLSYLREALEEDLYAYPILFEICPELELDKQVISMINYYKKEIETF